MLSQFGDGEQFEDDMSEHPLPAAVQDLPGEWREQPLEGVKEAVLSGIDDIPHGGRNSFDGLDFSIEMCPRHVKRKMLINYYYRVT
jgi:hypothetical protein